MDNYDNVPERLEIPDEQPLMAEDTQEQLQFEVTPEESPIAEPAAPRKRKNTIKGLIAVLVAVALVLGSSAATFGFCFARLAAQEKRTEQLVGELTDKIDRLEETLNDKSFTGNGNSISGSGNVGQDGDMTPGQVYAKIGNSVVVVTAQIVNPSGGSFITGVSYGTGFILSEDGFIVTNYHVIEGSSTVKITTADGVEYAAILRGYDATNDIAVLKVEAQNLQPVILGSSDDLIVGDQVVVVGNALGELTSSLTVGYISAKDRVITTDGSQINMLQTDAAVNSGNSGGPIFNMNGEVVGIITAKYSGTSASGASIEGIGFAIPIDDVTRKISDLVEYGYITGAYLGVMVHDVDRDVAEYYGLPYGVYVSDVTDGFCAKEAGVRNKDIIIALGEYSVTSLNSLTQALQNFRGGDVTTITVWRGGAEVELEITLDEKPAN